MVLKKVILAGLVLLPLCLLVVPASFELRVNRRLAIREVAISPALPQVLARRAMPRLRHVVIRVRKALRRRLRRAIHWLRVVRSHSVRSDRSDPSVGSAPPARTTI
ncbi:MAG: hypothetical protein WAM82_27310 [Thermoanaerobaculia bacterium]